jgi:integrase
MAKLAVRSATPPLAFPSQGTIIDRAGLSVDANSWVWALNHAVDSVQLDFRKLKFHSRAILEVTTKFLADMVKVSSVDHIQNTFLALCYLHRSEHFREADANGGILEECLISEVRQLKNFAHYRLHYVRAWYCWCADQGMKQFPEEIAERLRDLKIPGNKTGHAVRTRDPMKGAFDELEFIALTSKLRAIGPERLTTSENTLAWLAIACGANPLAYALAREEDYKPLKEEGTGRIHARFDLPRIKKGDAFFREQFHPKMLNDEIGSWVNRLIMENQSHRTQQGWPDGCAYPLFRRSEPDIGRINGPLREFAMHMTPEETTRTVQQAIAKLEIVSHRTGKPLIVNMRRFRRTYATRAVEDGASPTELAVMLDHSDLGTVQAYFETRANQVLRLDAATALRLGPIADAFMGRIVRSEREAVNGDNPAKRIPWYNRHPDRTPEKAGNLGTCGSGPCGLFAPLSCYTCVKFQPWKDGPHRDVLDWLCADRQRKEKDGLDPQIVGLHDATILAIAEVVNACEALPA